MYPLRILMVKKEEEIGEMIWKMFNKTTPIEIPDVYIVTLYIILLVDEGDADEANRILCGIRDC
jgi:hypothetical protein